MHNLHGLLVISMPIQADHLEIRALDDNHEMGGEQHFVGCSGCA